MFKKSVPVLILMLLSAGLAAREIDVTVEDADGGLPLEGARVRSGGAEYLTGEMGRVRIIAAEGNAVISVSYPGYETRRIVIAADEAVFRAALRSGGILEGRELVLEERRDSAGETRSGRSTGIAGEDLRRTAEIGVIEDVMTSIKLLPGVGYSGMFNALPSIRGGDPGDLMAALDGFYISSPYYWGGGVSIFDPRMVSAAKLSHGVFSARYGHTISGFLEITSRAPSRENVEIDTGLSTSAANAAISWPLASRGGIIFMGKVTYWDALVWALRGLNVFLENETLSMLDSVSIPPYIRSAALGADYLFSENIRFALNGFFGSDGTGAAYRNSYDDREIRGNVNIDGMYRNYQSFLITSLSLAPSPKTALRLAAGAGFAETIARGFVDNDVEVHYVDAFLQKYGSEPAMAGIDTNDTYHAPNFNGRIDSDALTATVQFRADVDTDLGGGFLFSAGAQELYSQWERHDAMGMYVEQRLDRLSPALQALLSGIAVAGMSDAAIIRPIEHSLAVLNRGFTSSVYGILEYAHPGGFFGAELGLRVDHLYFLSDGAGLNTLPAFNPRLNIDITLARNRGMIDSLILTLGTGLFSSINENIAFTDQRYGLDDFDILPNRSFTSLAGIKIDLSPGITFNIEGYYKYVFNRAYLAASLDAASISPRFFFDAEGRIGGFDLQLQKMGSRYWDGWISYSFNVARYREPSREQTGAGAGSPAGDGRWYYPLFHRFHNFNLVLNIKPSRRFNIALRFGFASGRPAGRAGEVYPYAVELVEWGNSGPVEKQWDAASGFWIDAPAGGGTIIQKFRRDTYFDGNERGAWSLPLDIKFSFFLFSKKHRVTTEVYLAGENMLSLIYRPRGNVRFNEYTGRVDTGDNAASYGLPVPMVSFGFTWRY